MSGTKPLGSRSRMPTWVLLVRRANRCRHIFPLRLEGDRTETRGFVISFFSFPNLFQSLGEADQAEVREA